MHTRLCRLFLINQKGNCWKSFFMATHNSVSFNECLLNKKNLIVFSLSVLFFHMSVTIVLSCVMSHAGARCRPETKAYSSNCYKPSSTHTRPTRQIIAPHHGRNYIIGLLHNTENCFLSVINLFIYLSVSI